MRVSHFAVPVLFAAMLLGCGKGEAPAAPATPAGAASDAAATAVEPKVPAGVYKLDPNHASLVAKVRHIGLADYHIRFTKLAVTLNFDPAKPEGSSLEVTIDPASVRTDFTGDYKASHKDSPYATFEEALARDAKFFNSGSFPTIAFKSTNVDVLGKGRYRVAGDLTFLGQTHPVTLDATVTGAMEKHPFTGRGALGFSATGSLTRSQWGMTGTQQYLGDAVTLLFDGEFQQAAPEEPAPTSEN